MTTLKVNLHPAQLAIFNSKARFKVVAAGRRFGKSHLAAWTLIIAALQSTQKDVFYIAPTFQQAKDILWGPLKDLARDVMTAAHENTAVVTLVNGRKIYLKGSDRPDTLRGVGLAYIVVDEYADMKPHVWEQILRPALADVKGGALFIGTPKGRNHFYDMHEDASAGRLGEDWEAFHFTSFDNPFLDPDEINAAKSTLSTFAFRQEFLASFEAAASDLFKPEWFIVEEEEPKEGEYFIAVDLAGFEDVAKQSGNKKTRLDETAIAIVKANRQGWWVKEIIHGRWDVKETAIRILKACRDHKTTVVGIEKGALKNAVTWHLTDIMRRTGYYVRVHELTHGNKRKVDRIVWALQGKMEHGRIKFNRGEWAKLCLDQLLQFPDSKTHDDLIDALAYVEQLITIAYVDQSDIEDTFEVMDDIAGY
jgi:predicted phage terminase large subunit-like protein